MNTIEKSLYPSLEKEIESIDLGEIGINQFYTTINSENKEKNDILTSNEPKESPQNIKAQFTPHSPEMPPPLQKKGTPRVSIVNHSKLEKEIPQELFKQSVYSVDSDKKTPPQVKFEKLVTKFYSDNPFVVDEKNHKNRELEVKFGTKGVKPLTRNDYDNVIKKLKSFGFTTTDSVGNYYLRINCEFLDSISGRFKLSDIRTEIRGLHNIQDYCTNNDIAEIIKNNFTCVSFEHKRIAVDEEKQRIFPVDFNDFNFRVSYSTEETVKHGISNYIIESWKKSKKTFRYLNRVTFIHPDYPFNIDISIVKNGNTVEGGRGEHQMKRVYTTQESNIFNNPEIYQIEIEVNNKLIGPGTKHKSPKQILESLRKAIKFVLGGLQGTNYPISYPEQKEVITSYMKIVNGEDYDHTKRVDNRNFIGHNSSTLQRVNIAPLEEN